MNTARPYLLSKKQIHTLIDFVKTKKDAKYEIDGYLDKELQSLHDSLVSQMLDVQYASENASTKVEIQVIEQAVNMVIDDLQGRSGFGNTLDGMSDFDKEELHDSLVLVILKEIRGF